MMPLGTRVVETPSLEDRITARLNDALQHVAGGGFESGFEVGLGYVEADPGQSGWIGLSVDDVARIAAAEAREWF